MKETGRDRGFQYFIIDKFIICTEKQNQTGKGQVGSPLSLCEV